MMLAARARDLGGDIEPALAHLRRAIAQAPDSIAPRVMLARTLQSRKRLAEAEVVWAEAVMRFPGTDGLIFDLATCREQRGDIAGAEAAVRDILEREPGNPQALNFLGYMWADHDRNLDEAVDMIQRALAADPDNGAFIDSLGWAYYRLGRLVEAREQLERAVLLTRGDPVVHEHLGDVYKDLQLKDLAKEQYKMSLAGDKTNERVKAKLSQLR
jgi:tetratricopeptide (TPR) repeat protein